MRFDKLTIKAQEALQQAQILAEDCKHPELTYGHLCVKCNECGRFDYGGDRNPVQSDIRVVTQRHEGIPPLWRYPNEYGGYFDHSKKQCWYRNTDKIKAGTTLEDIIGYWWWPDRLPYLRWWIEGRNY